MNSHSSRGTRTGGAADSVPLQGGDSGAGKSERVRPTMMEPIERQMMAVLLRVKVQAEQGTLEQMHADIMRLDPEIFDTHPEVCCTHLLQMGVRQACGATIP